MVVTYLIIFLLAAIPFFEIAAIIPIAIIGGVPAVPTMIIAFLGNMTTIVLLIVFVDKVKSWQEKRKVKKQKQQAKELLAAEGSEEQVMEVPSDEKKHKRAHSIWGKYGLPGLAFLGPFFVGSHLSAFLAVSFGGSRDRTLILMTASLLVWTFLLGIASYFGFDYFIADEDNLGFITRLLRLND